MVFNKEKETPHKAAGAGKGAVQHCIKTYCNAEKGENSHLSCHGNVHASVSTNSQLLAVCVSVVVSVCMFVCMCVCMCGCVYIDVFMCFCCYLSHW